MLEPEFEQLSAYSFGAALHPRRNDGSVSNSNNAIAALDAQRGLMGPQFVAAALRPVRERLAAARVAASKCRVGKRQADTRNATSQTS